MKSTTTYTKRSNARRAGIAAGVPAERLRITVHKKGGEVRFGWKAEASAAHGEALAVAERVGKSQFQVASKGGRTTEAPRERRNGVNRPKEGGKCAVIWQYLDANPTTTAKEIREVAIAKDWNANNASTELSQWRRFMGIAKPKRAVN